MFNFKERPVAGLSVLIKKPAAVTKETRVSCAILTGLVASLMTLGTIATPSNDDAPLPSQKPELAALPTGEIGHAASARDDQGVYISPFANAQMESYRDIFRLQALGKMDDAAAIAARLKDRSLMGHVLAQRYLHPDYKASFAELNGWLKRYADHPQAAKIARLANIRQPEGYKGLTAVSYKAAPIEEMAERAMAAKTYRPALVRTPGQDAEAAAMIADVRRQVQIYEPSAAMRTFNENPISATLDETEKNRIRAIVASGYLYAGKLGEAERLSGNALSASGANAPLAGWVHGLTLWRTGRHAQSAASFEKAANSPYASGWMAASASYWAARAHKEAGHGRRANHYLEKAASYPRTFYGLLASEALGKKADLDWAAPDLARADEKEILSTPAGLRAEKLLAAGEVILAESELRGLYVSGDMRRKQALLAFAYDRHLPSLSLKLGYAQGAEHKVNAALYPTMPWSPLRGYRIDRALLHAVARQESRFNATAENPRSGATGLMQIMPGTAYHVTKMELYRDAKGKALLKNPEISLDLAQHYMEELLNSPSVGQDLMSMAIAYNAGPGTLAKWKAERADITDPLLFMETIPFTETRTYVARVLANYWIYRMRFDQPNESMEALAEGRWARYAAYDRGAEKFAAAE